MRTRGVFGCVFPLLLCIVPAAAAQTIVRSARLGNNIEDITYISSGPLAGMFVIANGYDIFTAPLHRGGPSARPQRTKFFDARNTTTTDAPRGIAYLPDEKLIVFHSAADATLQLIDERGVYQGSRALQFAGAAPNYSEGLDYIPRSSALYPNHLVFAADGYTDPTLPVSLVIAKTDGTIDAQVPLQPFGCVTDPMTTGTTCAFDPSNTVLGIAYQAPDHLLVSLNDNTDNIWAIDFNGNVIGSGPVYSDAGTHSFEGIVELPDHEIVASNYFTGELMFLDRNMQPEPDDARVYSVGIGASGEFGLAWNSDTGRYLSTGRLVHILYSISPTLDDVTTVQLDETLAPGNPLGRIAYVADMHALAAISRTPASTFINFFDPQTGAYLPAATIQILNSLIPGRSQSVEYIPGTTPADGHFAIGTTTSVVFISRATRTIDQQWNAPLAVLQIAFDPSGPGGPRLLLTDNVTVAVTDLNGASQPGGFSIRSGLYLLGGRDLTAVTTGPDAGSLAIVDPDNSELLVFRLP